jgi:hypothetical protein
VRGASLYLILPLSQNIHADEESAEGGPKRLSPGSSPTNADGNGNGNDNGSGRGQISKGISSVLSSFATRSAKGAAGASAGKVVPVDTDAAMAAGAGSDGGTTKKSSPTHSNDRRSAADDEGDIQETKAVDDADDSENGNRRNAANKVTPVTDAPSFAPDAAAASGFNLKALVEQEEAEKRNVELFLSSALNNKDSQQKYV